MGNRRIIAILSFVILARATQQPAAAQSAEAVPDISGVWDIVLPVDPANPYGNPQEWFTREEPAMLPWAAARYKKIREGRSETRPEGGRAEMDPIHYPYCMPPGVPRVYAMSDREDVNFEIVQKPGRVLILFESDHIQRIFADGRKHPKGPPLTYMGQSIGRWEGDTLVVETKDLTEMSWIDDVGHPHTDALRVEQRIRRLDHDTLQIAFLFDDPKTYTKPWGATKTYKLRTKKDLRLEVTANSFACEDASSDAYSRNILGKKERDDAWRQLRKEGKGY